MRKMVSYRVDDLILAHAREMAVASGQTVTDVLEGALRLAYGVFGAIDIQHGEVDENAVTALVGPYARELRDRIELKGRAQ